MMKGPFKKRNIAPFTRNENIIIANGKRSPEDALAAVFSLVIETLLLYTEMS
jgi:hypothetical protein